MTSKAVGSGLHVCLSLLLLISAILPTMIPSAVLAESPDGIVVEDADWIGIDPLEPSPSMPDALPRVLVEYGGSIRRGGLEGTSALPDILPRTIVEYGSSIRHSTLEGTTALPDTLPRVIVEYGGSIVQANLQITADVPEIPPRIIVTSASSIVHATLAPMDEDPTITISPKEATIVAGESQAYTATATDEFGNVVDVTADTSFTIEAGAGGEWVDNAYTSEFYGVWTVTGIYQGLTDTATLSVTEPERDVPKFLTLPFSEPNIKIQQGWRYTAPIGPNPDDPYAHKGIDYIKGIVNEPATWQSFDVVAAADGVAMWSSGGGYGDFVLIRHDETDLEDRNYFTLYGHLRDIEDNVTHRADRFTTDYQSWTPVTRGQKIGEAGDTGSPGLIHLHFEVQRGGYAQNKVDPYDICSTRDYYPGGSSYVGCGPNSLWVASVCPARPDRDDARFVADVTIPDGMMIPPGEEFVKTWRLRNAGTTTWTTGYKLGFDGGHLMEAPQYVHIDGPVPPNATVEISVPMTAPLSGGAKRGYWRVENPAGLKFGHTVWVEIYVPNASSPELQEAIDNLYNTTMDRLEMLRTDMQTTAEHGDFFRGQVTGAQAALALTLTLGFASIASDVQDIHRLEHGMQLALPGMEAGWGDIIYLREKYEAAGWLFDMKWQHALETGTLDGLGPDILTGGLKYYAAAFRDQAVQDMSKQAIIWSLQEIAGHEAGLSHAFYPAFISVIEMAQQDLTQRRDQLLNSLPTMSPEEQAAYAADLNARAQAARDLYASSAYTVTNLSAIKGFYDQDWLTQATLTILRFAARTLAKVAFDGPGRLLVDTFLTAFDTYVNQFQLDEATRMLALAEGLMTGGIDASTQLHLNAGRGLDRVGDGMPPRTVTGHVESISHYSEGYNPWQPWTNWVETGSYSMVRLTNTSPEPATFRIVAAYPAEYKAIFGFSTILLGVAEEVVTVPAGDAVEAHLRYKDGASGSSPHTGGFMFIYVFGNNESGTFRVYAHGTNWNPQFVSQATGQVVPSLAGAENGEDIHIIDDPVYAFLSASPEDLSYEVHIWVTNPVAADLTATVVQDIPEEWEVLSAPGAQFNDDTQLMWDLEMEEGGLAQAFFTFAYHGDLALDIVAPDTTVHLETLDGDPLGAFIGTAAPLAPILSVTGHVSVPVEVLPGDQATVSVSLENVSAQTADGDVFVSVTDPSSSTVYDDTQAFSLAPSEGEVLDYLLPAFSEKGLYRVVTEISHAGVTRVISRDILRVGIMALDLRIGATPSDRVYPGDTITYTVSLNNTSTSTLHDVTAEAAFPAGTVAHNVSDEGQFVDSMVKWELPEPLAPGETRELSFQVTVLPDAIGLDEARTIKSTARAASDETLPVGSNEARILLVANPAEVMGTIAGEVDLYGQMDNGGVLVTVSGTHIKSTASDGHFAVDVPEGSHDVTFTCPGFSMVVHENVTVIAGEEVSVSPVVLVPSTIVTGQTREANCNILPKVSVCLNQDQVLLGCTVSDGEGNYTLAVPEFGDYEVVASKAGFRDETQTITVDEATTYTVDFVGSHGLIPNAPNMSYVLACINLWQFGEPQCKLSMSRVLAVINAWQFPVSDN